MSTKSSDILAELDAGVFIQKFNAALKKAGVATVSCGKQSKVMIELKFDHIQNSRQVMVTHKVLQVIPRETGKAADEDVKTTPVHVHSDGLMSIFSEDQKAFTFDNERGK